MRSLCQFAAVPGAGPRTSVHPMGDNGARIGVWGSLSRASWVPNEKNEVRGWRQ